MKGTQRIILIGYASNEYRMRNPINNKIEMAYSYILNQKLKDEMKK